MVTIKKKQLLVIVLLQNKYTKTACNLEVNEAAIISQTLK